MTPQASHSDPYTEWTGTVQTFVCELIPTAPLPPRNVLLDLVQGLHTELRNGAVMSAAELDDKVRELLRSQQGREPDSASVQVVSRALQLAVANQSDFGSALQSVLESQ